MDVGGIFILLFVYFTIAGISFLTRTEMGNDDDELAAAKSIFWILLLLVTIITLFIRIMKHSYNQIMTGLTE